VADQPNVSAIKIFCMCRRLSVVSRGLLDDLVQQARTRCANFGQTHTRELNTV
jgi:hypothetical protein